MPEDSHVALLAPVPLEHLRSGLETLQKEGRVAFGSKAYQVFDTLDLERGEIPVRVWIYASDHDDQPVPLSATWTALYVGRVESKGGAHPEGMRYRPESTRNNASDNEGFWAVFWHVTDLRELRDAERVPVAAFTGWKQPKPYGHPFEPEGPTIVLAV